MKKQISLLALFCFAHLFSGAQVTQTWSNNFNAPGDNSDRYNAMVADGSGNYYLAGYTYSLGTDKDFLVVKVNSAGDTLWTRKYNHNANLSDEALFITRDVSGSIYVTGLSDGGYSVSKNDILTLKYNSSGSLQWVARYNYTAFNEDDIPVGIAADNLGNVFISGRSDHDANNVDDMVTIKYNSSGIEQWAIRYNGVANGIDRPVGVVANNLGGCIIGGRYDNGIDDDFITISYSSSGVETWTATYNNGFGSDRATAFAKDDSGNVYISGRSFNGADDDFTTIKYNASGLQQWVAIYESGNDDRAVAMFVDASRNVYVTGQTDAGSGGNTNYNIKTVKYNSSGIQQWAKGLAGSPNFEDVPESIYADAAGNVYVTGKSDSNSTTIQANQFLTVKYNATGVSQWAAFYNGNVLNGDDIPASVYVDATGNVFVIGSAIFATTQKDAVILKYSSAGSLLTTKKYNGTGDFTEKVKAMVLDKNKNMFMTGYTMGAGTQKDLFVQKVNASGITEWFRTYDGSGDNDEGNAITTDTSGNIYVTGYSNGTGTFDDFITIKYNSNGDTVWTRRYNYTARQDDRAVSIGVTGSGTVYITGYSDNNPDPLVTNYDYATIKYNVNGLQQWVMRYNGTGNGSDRAVKLLLTSGHIYVTGRSFNGLNEDVVTLDYSTAGLIQHTVVYNGPIAGDDQPADAFLDGSNVFITGSTFAGSAADNILTIKYNGSLVQQWVSSYNATSDTTDKGSALTANSSGIYVAGRTMNVNGSDDLILLKLNKTNGSLTWKNTYNGIAGLNDRGNSLCTDTNGNVIVAGETAAANGLQDAVVLNYNPSGALNWSQVYNGSSNGDDSWKVVCTDLSGMVYAAGYSQSVSGGYDNFVRAYCSSPVALITPAGPTTFCSGSQVLLNANNGAGLSYQWQKNATNISGATAIGYIASSTGLYTVLVTANANCRSFSAGKSVTSQNASANITPSGPTTFCAGDSVKLQANTGNGYTYQWKLNGTNISGAVASVFTAKAAGIYKVVVSNSNGCTKLSSGVTVTVNCRGNNSETYEQNDLVYIYPNPFIDIIHVERSSEMEDLLQIAIYDVNGKKVLETLLQEHTRDIEMNKNLPAGVYSLQVTGKGFFQSKRLIKIQLQ